VSEERRPIGRRTNWASLVFGALAVVLAAAAIVLFVRDDAEEERAPPPAPPGENELIHVQQALRAEGLEAESAQGGVAARALDVPGQRLVVDDASLYVFRYPDEAAAAAALAAATPAAILPARSPSGTPIADGVPFVTGHSNVIVALVGGSEELRERVDRAIRGLP
jgi:hypothetical protein